MSFELPKSQYPKILDSGIYETDLFNRHPIFAVEVPSITSSNRFYFCRSWKDAFSFKGSVSLEDINNRYLGSIITGTPNSDISPYSFIRRMPRSHHVVIRNAQFSCYEYNPFHGGVSKFNIKEEFYEFVKFTLTKKIEKTLLLQNGLIGIEQSSGIDSNSILSILRKELNIKPNLIHAWSNAVIGEKKLIKEFQDFYGLLPNNCHTIKNENINLDSLKRDAYKIVSILGYPHQIGGVISEFEKLSDKKCNILFSGLGGDQCLSNNASNVPTSLVYNFDFWELHNWTSDSFITLKIIFSRFLAKINRSWAENKIKNDIYRTRKNNILIECLTDQASEDLKPFLNIPYPFEVDYYLDHYTSIKKRISGDWLSVRLEEEKIIGNFHNINVEHPLMDEFLISSCLNQDLKVFGNSFEDGRLIFRKGFSEILPEFLQKNSSKKRYIENYSYNNSIKNGFQDLESLIEDSKEWHNYLENFWDMDLIRIKANKFIKNNISYENLNDNDKYFLAVDILNFKDVFYKLLKLEIWFSLLD